MPFVGFHYLMNPLCDLLYFPIYIHCFSICIFYYNSIKLKLLLASPPTHIQMLLNMSVYHLRGLTSKFRVCSFHRPQLVVWWPRRVNCILMRFCQMLHRKVLSAPLLLSTLPYTSFCSYSRGCPPLVFGWCMKI